MEKTVLNHFLHNFCDKRTFNIYGETVLDHLEDNFCNNHTFFIYGENSVKPFLT